MSIKKFLMLFALPLALVLGSCENPTPDASGILPEFELTDVTGAGTNKVEFPAEGGELIVNITANRAWSIAVAADWFAVTPSSQPNADHKSITTQVKFNAFANTTGAARQAEITISIEGFGDAKLTVSQLAEGQVATGKVIYYDNFDKGTAVENSGWPALDDFVNPTGEAAEGATYSIANVQARSNSQSNNSHSGYKDEASGGNNAFFRTSGVLTINNLNLAGQDSKDYTLSFGCYRSVFGDTDNSFKASEFHVYVSGDGEKWTELAYTRPADEVSSYGTWNLATATFTLKEKPSTLSICFVSDLVSSHRLDDVKLNIGGGGAEIDLSQGTAISGGSTGGTTTGAPTSLKEVTIAEFNAATVDNTTWYKLTGEIVSIVKEEYGNFTIKDSTGEVYIYGMTNGWVGSNDKSFSQIGLKVGDTVTLGTLRGEFNGTIQGGGKEVPAYYISHTAGSGGGSGGNDTPVTPGEVQEISVIDFLAKSPASNVWYKLTGKISNIASTAYGNFDLVDETGTVYVYGLTKTQVEKNDQSFSSLGLKEGDIVTLIGVRAVYNDSPQVGSAYYVSHVEGEAPEVDENVVKISFADVANRTSLSKTQQVWQQNGITVTNDKGASTTDVADYSGPARFYKSSNLTIEAEKEMTQIVVNTTGGNKYYLNLSDGNGYTVSGSGTSKATITLATPAKSFTITGLANQVRCTTIEVTLAE